MVKAAWLLLRQVCQPSSIVVVAKTGQHALKKTVLFKQTAEDAERRVTVKTLTLSGGKTYASTTELRAALK